MLVCVTVVLGGEELRLYLLIAYDSAGGEVSRAHDLHVLAPEGYNLVEEQIGVLGGLPRRGHNRHGGSCPRVRHAVG